MPIANNLEVLNTISSPNTRWLIPEQADKNTRHRLAKYAQWLDVQGRPWYRPDLVSYRNFLLERGRTDGSGLKPTSVAAHMATIRARYRRLLRQQEVRDHFLEIAGEMLHRPGQADTPTNRKTLADELLVRIQNAIQPDESCVNVLVSPNRPNEAQRRLTPQQANALMNAPGTGTLRGLRDTAMISLMLCTGIRADELAVLEVKDLTHRFDAQLALHVHEGHRSNERIIPYGKMGWAVPTVQEWLEAAGITSGAVFRGLCTGDKKLRSGAISVRAIQYVIASYPIMISRQMTSISPLDLRRTYARRLYDEGIPLPAIQKYLGHASIDTTMGYIGDPAMPQRSTDEAYRFELEK